MTPTQRSLVSNLASQVLTLALGLVCLPLVVRYVGVEAYGLVGLLWALQSVVLVCDLGWGVAANRELARLSASSENAHAMRSMVRVLGRRYLAAALVLCAVAWLVGPWFGRVWLQPRELSNHQVAQAMQWIGVAIALQGAFAFFSACVSGLQRIVALSVIRAVGSTASYPGAVLLLAYWSPTLNCFLAVQVLVVGLQNVATLLLLWRSLPAAQTTAPTTKVDWAGLRQFASSVFGISVAGLLLSQGDKLLLSKCLSLDQFGYYSLAATVSAGLLSVGTPVFSVVFPRFSQLHGAGAVEQLEVLYHQAAQFLAVLVVPVGAVLAVFPDAALWAWTGNSDVVSQVTPILRWLVMGSTLVGLTNVPYALQLAHGWTRLPLVINVSAVAMMLPLMALLARWYGGAGAAAAWLIMGLVYVFVSVPLMHRYLLIGAGWRWLLADNSGPLLAASFVAIAVRAVVPTTTRLQAGSAVVMALALSFAAAFLVAPTTREWTWGLLRARRARPHAA